MRREHHSQGLDGPWLTTQTGASMGASSSAIIRAWLLLMFKSLNESLALWLSRLKPSLTAEEEEEEEEAG